MVNNLKALHILAKCDNSDDFYFVIIKDKEFILPLAINYHTNINKIINYIKRVCKSNGKAYLFIDKKSVKKLSLILIHEFLNILNCEDEIFAKLKNSILNVCCSDKCSVENSKRFIIDDNFYIPNCKLLLHIKIDKSYLIGKIHDIDKRYIKYLKEYCYYQENAKILIYSKSE